MQPVNTPYAELVGDGSSTEIEFDFSVDIASTSPSGSQSYPRVRLITYDEDTGVLESVETLTYGTDYTVALTAKDSEAGDLAYPGGTITLTEAPETYQTVYVDRVSPLTQSTIFPTGGQLNLRTLEAKLDYLTRIVQEQELDLSRIPVSSDPTAQPVFWYATEDDWGKYAFLDLSGNAVFVTEVTPGNLTLTNQGDGRVGYGGATDEIRFDAGFEYDEAMNTVKLGGLTASRAVVTDANKKLVSSAVTATELGYVAGVTSAIQTQLDATVRVLARSSGFVTVGNTDAETTIVSYTVPGNTLGTNRRIQITCVGSWSHDGTNTATIRLYYGATLVASCIVNVGGATTGGNVVVEAHLRAVNDTAIQQGNIIITHDQGGDIQQVNADQDGGTEDSTTAKTLSVTWEWGTVDPGDTVSLASDIVLY